MASTSSIRAQLVSASRKWPAMDSETAWKTSATGRVVNAPAARAIVTQRPDSSKVAWSSHKLPAAAVPSANQRRPTAGSRSSASSAATAARNGGTEAW